MLLNDVIQFTVYGKNLGESWQCSRHYRVINIDTYADGVSFSGAAASFLTWFTLNVWDAMDAVTSNTASLEGCKVKNLFSAGNVGEATHASPPTGDVAGEQAAPFLTYKLKQPLGRAGMRPGFISLPGVTEGGMAPGGLLHSEVVTALTAAGEALSDDQLIQSPAEDLIFDMRPVIIKRFRTGAGTPVSPYKYRLPETQAELGVNWYVANAWAPYPYITTVGSRKYGRGD